MTPEAWNGQDEGNTPCSFDFWPQIVVSEGNVARSVSATGTSGKQDQLLNAYVL